MKAKSKRIITLVVMMLVFTMSFGTVAFAEEIKKVTFKSNDGNTTAVGTISWEFNVICRDVGGAATAIDGESAVIDRRVFTAIFALNKNGGIVNSKTQRTDCYDMMTIRANCKSFKSKHQIIAANGAPVAKMRTQTS